MKTPRPYSPQRMQAPLRSFTNSTQGVAARTPLPDECMLSALQNSFAAVLAAPGITQVHPGDLFADMDIAEVGMDELKMRWVSAGQALGTKGVATCFALCARGPVHEGKTLVALGHYSSVTEPADALSDVHAAMDEEGGEDYSLYVIGGAVSRLIDPSAPTGNLEEQENAGSIIEAQAYLEGGGQALVAARVGLSECGADEPYPLPAGHIIAPATGRPESVQVVINSDGVFFAPCEKDGLDLFATSNAAGAAHGADDSRDDSEHL